MKTRECVNCDELVETLHPSPLNAGEYWCRECCKEYGFSEVPAIVLGMTDEEHEEMQRAERRLFESRSGRYDRQAGER